MTPLLRAKDAAIYGAGGATGGAGYHAFASEGAGVFLAGRTLAGLDKVAGQIRSTGGLTEAAGGDAFDERRGGENTSA